MVRLEVPYREKDTVKALGARWNPVGKFWYCEELTEALKPWYHGSREAAGKRRLRILDGKIIMRPGNPVIIYDFALDQDVPKQRGRKESIRNQRVDLGNGPVTGGAGQRVFLPEQQLFPYQIRTGRRCCRLSASVIPGL